MLLRSKEDIDRHLNAKLQHENEVVLDLETTGLWAWRGDQILSVSLYLPSYKESYTIIVGHGGSLFSIEPSSLEWVAWHEVNQCRVIMHNAKFDMSFLEAAGVTIDWGRVFDTLTGQFLLHNLSESFALKKLTSDLEADSEEWLRYAPEGLDLGLARETMSSRANLSSVAEDALVAYAETDVVLTYILYMRQRAENEQSERAYSPLSFMGREMLLTRSVMNIEKRGLQFAWPKHYEIKSAMERDLIAMRQGFVFDPMSSNALRNVFGTDTYDKETLKTIGGDLGEQVIAYRELQHDYSSFVVKLASFVSEDEFLHPNLRQNGTNTGRFTSSNPNVLGLPKKMRTQFTPPKGREYVCMDLTQIELAMCAWYSGCTPMLEAFEQKLDIHQATADLVGVERQIGKRLNFSMVYGVGAETMSKRLGVDQAQAMRWIRGFRQAYPELVASKVRCEAAARRNGELKLWNGQVREVPEVHKAWSYLIQSAVAELAKDILIDLDQLMAEVGGNVVLHVHDEFVIEVDKGDEEAKARAKAVVVSAGPDGLHYSTDSEPWYDGGGE